jgi:hypothetical protein
LIPGSGGLNVGVAFDSMTKPNSNWAAVLAALVMVGCAPAPEARVVELPAGSAGVARADEATQEEAGFARSKCVREGTVTSIDLGLGAEPKLGWVSAGPARARVWLASGASDAVLVEAETLGAALEGVAVLPSVPLGVSKAFEGFASMRKPGYARRGLVRKTTALPDGRFEVTLAAPEGLTPANKDTLRVVATCEELTMLEDEPWSSLPRSPNESGASLLREQVAVSKTPGGEPIAFVTERSECGRPVVLVDQQGSSALVRIYLDEAVVYGWVDGAAIGPPSPAGIRPGCDFGMIGLLNAGAGPSDENRPTRHVCKGPTSLFARKGAKPIRVGQLTRESCLHVTQAKKEDGFVAVELEGRVSSEIQPKPGVSLYVTEADWAGCTREEPSDGPRWSTCD